MLTVWCKNFLLDFTSRSFTYELYQIAERYVKYIYQPCISAEISFAKAARAAALLPLTADFTVVVFSQILQFLSVSTASRIFAGGGRPSSVINYRKCLIWNIKAFHIRNIIVHLGINLKIVRSRHQHYVTAAEGLWNEIRHVGRRDVIHGDILNTELWQFIRKIICGISVLP